VPLIASEQLERTILEVGRTRGVRAVEQLRRVVVPFPSGFSRGTDFLLAKGG
jgi:RecB family endonuclease NucS